MMKKLLVVFTLIVLIACGSSGNKASENEDSGKSNESQPTAAKQTNNQGGNEGASDISANGEKIYKQYCMACHQANGKGVQGMYPTLIGTNWVLGDKGRLIGVILNGLQGEIEVKGKTYNNIMPSHNFLSDQEVADVLTYVRKMGENDAPAITPEEVKAVRDTL